MPPKRKVSAAAYLEALYTNKNFKWPKANGLVTLWEESPRLPTQKRKRVIAQQPIKRLIDFDKDTVTKRKQKKQARVKKVKAVKGWMPRRKTKSDKSIEEKLNALLDCTDLVENSSDVVSLKNVSLCTTNNVLENDDMNNFGCPERKLADDFNVDHAANEKTLFFCSGDYSGERNYSSKPLLYANACHDTNTIRGYGSEANNVPFLRFTDLPSNSDTKLSDYCTGHCEDVQLDSVPTDNDFCNKSEDKLLRPSSKSVAISSHSDTKTEEPCFCVDNIVEIHKALGSDVHRLLRANSNRKGFSENNTIEIYPKIADTFNNVKETYLKTDTEKDLHSEVICKPNILADEANVEKENSSSFVANDVDHHPSSSDENLFKPEKSKASNFARVSVFDHLPELNECDENVSEKMIQHVNFIDEDIDKLISAVTQVHQRKNSEKKRKRRRDSTAAFSSLALKLAQAESAFSSETELFCSMKDNS